MAISERQKTLALQQQFLQQQQQALGAAAPSSSSTPTAGAAPTSLDSTTLPGNSAQGERYTESNQNHFLYTNTRLNMSLNKGEGER